MTKEQDALQALEKLYAAAYDISGFTENLHIDDAYNAIREALTAPPVDVESLIPDFVENCKNAPMLTNADYGLLSCFIDHLKEKGLLPEGKD